MSPTIQIRLLGQFRITMGDERAAHEGLSRRAAELIELLCLQPQRTLLHDQAVEHLWPHLDPLAGSANLRKAAHHARLALGDPEAVVLRGGRVRLFPDRVVACDLATFMAAADDALRRRDPAACAAAASLYGGELLPDARYEPWSDEPRRKVRDTYVRLLREAGDLERLAREDPTDEVAHQELMRRALAAGRRAEALRLYGRLREHLEHALGLRPSAQTEALYQACIADFPSLAPPFVGRSLELARMNALLNAAPPDNADPSTGDAPSAALVRAPAGMGKSSFCRRVAEQARERGWRVCWGEANRDPRPYGLVVDLVEPLLLDDRTLLQTIGSHAHSVLAALTPAAAPAPPLAGALSRHQVVGMLRRLLLAAGGTAPVLVVAENAESADAASAEVLVQLAATGAPPFVLFACRPPLPGVLEQGLARLTRAGRLASIELPPLDADESRALAIRAAPRGLDEDAVAAIARLAQGHPFAIVELARAPRAGDGASTTQALPTSVAAAISARIGDFDAQAMEALRRIALAGEDLDVATVLALAGDWQEQALERLDQALVAAVLVVEQGRYRFRHALVRQALVDAVPPHRRLKLHREVALRLQAAGAASQRLAAQWLAAGDLPAAMPPILAAASEAFRLAAFADVLRHLEPLLAQMPQHPEALALKAESIDALGQPGALAAYDAAAAVASEVQSHELRAKRALAQVKLSDPQGALRFLVGVEPATVAGRLAAALAYSGAAALGYGDPAEGTRRAAESRRLALETGDRGSLVIASWAQAAAAHARGDLHGSVWADLQETHHLPELAMRVFDGHLCITQRFLYGSRPYADVITFADRLAIEAERLGAARGLAFAITLRGEARLLSGQLDLAEQDLVAGGRLHQGIGGATGEALSLQRRAELAMYRGQPAKARSLLDQALDVARQSDVGFHLLDRIYGTRVALARNPDAALAELEEADAAVRGPLETCPGCRITFAVPATIAAARAQALELANHHQQAAQYLADVVMKLPAWYAALREARGHVALAAGQREAAQSAFVEAAQQFREAGQPLDDARCREWAGGG